MSGPSVVEERLAVNREVEDFRPHTSVLGPISFFTSTSEAVQKEISRVRQHFLSHRGLRQQACDLDRPDHG